MDLDLLRNADIFGELDADELQAVAEICTETTIDRGKAVFREGEPGNRLFIVSSGEVRISRVVPGSGEEALAVLPRGACFGEMSVFDRSERSTDAIANSDCTLITIARPDFEMLLDFNRDLAYKVLWSVIHTMSRRLRVANENLRSFLAMSMF
jgi:CRP/FNR family transcriptional regulator, cyclic AMP receptor protein